MVTNSTLALLLAKTLKEGGIEISPRCLCRLLQVVSYKQCESFSLMRERLELLGDKALALSITFYLFNIYSQDDEGDLSIKLNFITSRSFLSTLMKKLELTGLCTQYKSTFDNKFNKLISSALEVILGFVYLHYGFSAVDKLILHLFKPYISALKTSYIKSPKNILQEWLSKRHINFQYIDIPPIKHFGETLFICMLHFYIGARSIHILGFGLSKKASQINAARECILKCSLYDKLVYRKK